MESSEKCTNCDNREFDCHEGMFFCTECGFQQANRFEIVMTCDENDGELLKEVRKKKLDLTSWEQYNLIILGIIEKLIHAGAKPDLKLIALQLWTSYLRVYQIAFFGEDIYTTPHLGLNFRKTDARIIYAQIMAHSERKRSTGLRNNITSLIALEEAEEMRVNIPVVEKSNKDIRPLEFADYVRFIMLREMNENHYKKHRLEPILACHKYTKNKTLGRVNAARLSFSTIIAIVCLALNLVCDEMHCGDLMRFLREGHIQLGAYESYLPDNAGDQSPMSSKYSGLPNGTRTKEFCTDLCKVLKINELTLREADVLKLIKRYISIMSLPNDVFEIAEKVFKYHPIELKSSNFPDYELTAMTYVLFSLKFVFGLDGHREMEMSKSAHNINCQIRSLNRNKQTEAPVPLFVWSEWMEMIEIRYYFLSQYHSATHSKYPTLQYQSTHLLFDLLKQTNQHINSWEWKDKAKNGFMYKYIRLLKRLNGIQKTDSKDDFFSIKECQKEEEPKRILKFPPTLQPYINYVKYIADKCPDIHVPTELTIDYFKHDVFSFLNQTQLRNYLLTTHSVKLNVKKCPSNVFTKLKRPPKRHEDKKNLKRVYTCENVAERFWNPMHTDFDLKSYSSDLNSAHLETDDDLDSDEPGSKKLRRDEVADTDCVLTLSTHDFRYWSFIAGSKRNPNLDQDTFAKLQCFIPESFLWLLNVCAEIIEVQPTHLFRYFMKYEEQLLHLKVADLNLKSKY